MGEPKDRTEALLLEMKRLHRRLDVMSRELQMVSTRLTYLSLKIEEVTGLPDDEVEWPEGFPKP